MKFKLVKLGNTENPVHLNSTFGNSKTHIGYSDVLPTVGSTFSLIPSQEDVQGIRTSTLVSVNLEDRTFSTLNSVYQWEIIEE